MVNLAKEIFKVSSIDQAETSRLAYLMWWFKSTLLAQSRTRLQKCEAYTGWELVFLHDEDQLIVYVSLKQFLKLGDPNFGFWLLVKVFQNIWPFRDFWVIFLLGHRLQSMLFILHFIIEQLNVVTHIFLYLWKFSQVYDLDKHRHWVFAFGCCYGESEFEHDVGLVKVEDF